ncbi:MAG: cytochrome c biogenesis protein CcdA, partial [Vicinamibacterales bacterium]
MRNNALLVALALFVSAPSFLWAQRGPAKADLSPLVETATVTPGSEVRVALQVQLPEGYHMNSNKPRDPMLIPVVLTVPSPDQPLPAGITVSEIVFPSPADLVQRGADQPLSVFERQFAIGVVLKVDASVTPGTVTIPARLRYQACDETMCYIPTRAETGWTFDIGTSRSAAQHAEVFGTIAFGTGDKPAGAGAPGVVAADLQVRTSPAPPASADAEIAALDGFAEQGTTFGYLPADDFLTFISNAEKGVREKGMLEGQGPVAILLIVLLGGLALNLTPCVLPMIPINLAIIGAGAQAGSRRRGFLLGLVYGGAMALVYGVLGLIVVLTASSFGTINASPWFNLGIAVLFVVLGLAMFDIVNIDFSRFSSNLKTGSSQGSMALAFTMGAVAALLAGACVAPVVIQVVVFSSYLYAAGTTAALALPFVLGVGMAIPWPIAGAGIAALPKPGA